MKIDSDKSNPADFIVANPLELGSSVASPVGATLNVSQGSVQISEPIEINGDSIIYLPTNGSELLLDDGSSTAAPSMLKGADYGSCSVSSPCDLIVRGPGITGESAAVKTFRDAGVASSNGIDLFSTYGSGSALVNLELSDNIVFRVSGDSGFSGTDSGGNTVSADVEIVNAEFQVFPDVQLYPEPPNNSVKLRSQDPLLSHATVTLLSDATN